MATAHRILIPANDTGLWKTKQQDAETAAKVTALLQDDFEKHHVFFNASGFHNHIVHHLLSLYGTGASVPVLQAAYDANKSYQQKIIPVRDDVVKELQLDWSANAKKYLGLGKHYSDFLSFFQLEMDSRGWEAVVREFLCEETSKSRDIVQRLFAGICHPMIQLHYGLEWEQPAIIAAGLAQAAVHGNPLGDFFDKVDAAVKSPKSGENVEYRCLSEICENIRTDHPSLASSAAWEDENALYEGVLGKGLHEAVALAAALRVNEDNLNERTAEMLHHNAHSLNSSIFFLSLGKSFVPAWARVRLLEHKIRYDLVQYIARGCAPLSMSSIRAYTPEALAQVSSPVDILPKFHEISDDGHSIKVVRSLFLAQDVSRGWSGRPWIRLVGDEDWLKAHYMLLKGVQGQEMRWVFGAGFQDAWKDVPRV
ncbi:hypothetical protein E4U41_000584 [Claviceps citrina]|nr:hypothetical protein E4U41_000584 [Claviceps citrina]